MTIKNTELIISIITVLLTYGVCASLIGYVRAWVAGQMGDDTPEQLGFLTLNPFVHVSRIWLILIIWLQVLSQYMPFGLGRYVPINPHNIQGGSRTLKLATAYFSDTIAAIGVSIIAFFTMLSIHGQLAMKFLHHTVTLHNLALSNPAASTFSLITTWFLLTFFIMSSLMAAFSLIINCFHFIYFSFFEESLRNNEYTDMIMLFGPLLLLYITIYMVRDSIMIFVIYVARLLAFLVGIV